MRPDVEDAVNSQPISPGGQSPLNPEDSIQAVCERLGRAVHFVDEKGYEDEITAGAIHPTTGWLAWVRCKRKTQANGFVDIEFRLQAQAEDRLSIDWIVETYNPYFGCDVRYMSWQDRWVILVYREKHHTYACSHTLTGERQLVQLTEEWLVTDSQITCRSQEPDLVDCFTLPDLPRLPPLSADEARRAGMLPPEYDRRNEWEKRYARERRQQAQKTTLTEPEWFRSSQPEEMLSSLRGKASERKLRLFAVACCRRIWVELRDERSRRAVEVAEDFAEGRCDERTLSQARSDAMTAHGVAQGVRIGIPRTSANLDALRVAYAAAEAANAAQQAAATDAYQATAAVAGTAAYGASGGESSRSEQAIEAALLRDIFGNPFHPLTAHSSWLTLTVLGIARSIYEEQAFDRMPILADALEDAGCDNADILNHCRQPGEHVRGCWAVDLLLGKE
jgi:hypothetical protein